MLKILKKLKLNTRHRRYPASAIPGIILTAIIIVAGLLYIFNKPVVVEAEWWNDGWRYRQTITITNGGTAQTDFQIAITDDTAALVTAGKLQSDCDDIRITDIAGNVLPHWIETGTCNTVTTEIWTKLASIPTTATTLYLYYGNPSATSVESGTNVFIFFDDFSNGLGKWTPTGSEIFSISSGVLNITPASSNQYLIANQSIGTNGFVIETEMKSNHTTGSGHPGVMWHANTSTGSAHRNDHVYVRPHSYNTTSNIEPAYYNGALQTFTDITGLYNYNTWYEIKIELVNANSVKYYRDGVNEANWANQQYQSNTYVGVAVHSTNNQQWDDYRVRKYAATEPVAGSPISEEKGPGPIAYWKFDEGYGNAAKDSVRSSGYIANATGGTITEVGGYRIHTFTTSGTFTPTTNGSVEVLIVAGGGGGSENIYDDGSGGGGGGFITTTTSALAQGYTVTVGAGGAIHTNGDNSSVFGLTAIGGGRGASHRATNTYTGGSGGGAGGAYDAADGGGDGITDGGSGTPGQGYDGGTNTWASGVGYAGAGGGGAGGFGFSSGSYIGGDGGPGKVSSISGTATYYAGGGGGYGNSSGGTGGIGGGGTCVNPSTVTTAGGANTGGGGAGGSTDRTSRASAGGSGIVIIRYPVASSDGVVSGATWQTEDMCVSGKCLYFDGTNDYVDTGTGPKPTSAITMTAWVRPTVVDGAVHNVIDHHNGYEFQERDDSNWRTYINLSSSSWQSAICTSVTVQPNQWYFISGTYDSSTGLIKTYVDGDFCESTGGFTGQTIAYSGTDKTAIGGMNDATGRFFEGFIDEVKIYEYERSAAQIKADYLAGQSGSPSGASASFGGGQQQEQSEGLVGYWKMDEASGNALDSSGNGRTGTAFGTGSWEAGKYGNSYGNDGNHSGFELGTAQILPDGSDATLSFWAKVNADFSNSYIGIFTAWGSSGPNTYWYGIRRDTGATGWGMHYNDATNSANIMGASLTIGQWHHYSFVVDGTARRLYFDGNFIGEATSGHVGWNDGARTSGTSGTMRTVGVTSYASYLTDHNTDDVRLYNVARTADQIMRDYKTGPGPITYYDFEEGSGTTLFDKSGNGHNSTAFVGDPTWELGKRGSSLDFNGNDSVTLASNNMNGARQGTWSFWAKWDQAPSYEQIYIQEASTWIAHYSGNLGIDLSDGAWFDGNGGHNTGAMFSASAFTDLAWHHASFIWDGTYVSGYLDGVLDFGPIATTGVASLQNGTTPRAIGVRSSNYYHVGNIDDFKIYNYARTQEQILWDMYGDESPHPIAYWDFNEGYGDTSMNIGINSDVMNLAGACPGVSTCPSWTPDGRTNGALSFDGTDDYAVSTFSVSGSNGTAMFWVKDAVQGTGVYLLRSEANVRTYMDVIGANFTFYKGDPAVTMGSIPKPASGIWSHLTLKWWTEGSTLYGQSYMNGEPIIDPKVFTNSSNGTYISLGSFSSTGGQNAAGIIDDVKYFNYALSTEQIRQEANLGSQVSLGQQKESSETWDAGGFGGNAPIGHWNFEDSDQTTSLYDKAGTNNGTLVGSMTSGDWVLGKIGSGLDINDSQGALLSSTINLADTSNWTISAWMKTDSLDEETVISNSSGGPVTSDLGMHSNKMMYRHYYDADGGGPNPAAWYYEYGTSTINDNQWHFLTWVNYSNQTIDLYVDGVLENDGAVSTETSNGPVNQIGRNWGTGADIIIDEVKYFNYARSAAQIAYDYNGGKPVGWWRFNDGEGIIARDNSGNGNDGTLTLMDPATDWLDGTSCKYEGCLNFDSTDDYIVISSMDSKDLYNISFWLNAPDGISKTYTGYYPTIISFNNNAYHISGSSWTSGATDEVLHIWGGGGMTYIRDEFTANEWYFVSINWNGSTYDFYVDGVLKTAYAHTSGGDASLVAGITAMHIGDNYSTYDYKGKLDDVRIYNYALTVDQIKEVMNYGSVYIK